MAGWMQNSLPLRIKFIVKTDLRKTHRECMNGNRKHDTHTHTLIITSYVCREPGVRRKTESAVPLLPHLCIHHTVASI